MSIFLGKRNYMGLTPVQIERCLMIWLELCGDKPRILNVEEAHLDGSRTRFSESQHVIFLGADAYPGEALNANSRLSPLACLAHELSHIERYEKGYNRALNMPDVLIDEAETSLDASFQIVLSKRDRQDLIEDARDRLNEWLHRPPDIGDNDDNYS